MHSTTFFVFFSDFFVSKCESIFWPVTRKNISKRVRGRAIICEDESLACLIAGQFNCLNNEHFLNMQPDKRCLLTDNFYFMVFFYLPKKTGIGTKLGYI